MLVVHGGAGLDDHAKAQASRFAQLGLITFACDMYGEDALSDRARAMACVTEMRDDPRKMIKRAGKGLEVLAPRPRRTGGWDSPAAIRTSEPYPARVPLAGFPNRQSVDKVTQ